MHNIRILALLSATLSLTGCGDLISLHALYTPQDNVLDPALEGKWENKDNLLTVERGAGFYEVELQSKKEPSESMRYQMRLVNIGAVRFADLLSSETIGHMFLKVRIAADQLHFSFFDSQWLRDRIPHDDADMVNHRKQAVLTAQTSELRTIVAKYASEPKAFDEETVYRRMR